MNINEDIRNWRKMKKNMGCTLNSTNISAANCPRILNLVQKNANTYNFFPSGQV